MRLILKILMFFAVFIAGCVPESKKNEPRKLPISIDTTIQQTEKKEDIVVFPLPTPIQTVSIIKSFELPFNDSVNQNINKTFILDNKLKKAFLLGVFSVDISYNLVYQRASDAAKYYQKFDLLLKELNISSPNGINFSQINPGENPQSIVNKYMQIFEETLNQMTSSELTDLHLATIIGIYAESLNICLTQNFKNHINLRKNLIKQHRLFCDSILKLIVIQKLETKIGDLYQKLLKIRDYYDAMISQQEMQKNHIFVLKSLVQDMKKSMIK